MLASDGRPEEEDLTHAARQAPSNAWGKCAAAQPCPRCHSPRLPHRVCPVCGTYAGREVIKHEIAEATPTETAGGEEG